MSACGQKSGSNDRATLAGRESVTAAELREIDPGVRSAEGRIQSFIVLGAMGLAFAFVGTAYSDRPVIGLLLSALVPVVVWPVVHVKLRIKSSTSE